MAPVRAAAACALILLAASASAQGYFGATRAVEGDAYSKKVDVFVNLSTPLPYPFEFRVFTRNGTAVSGLDYERLDRTLTIPQGRKYISFQLTILGDRRAEREEKFTLVFDGWGYDAEFTIVDDDEPSDLPIVSIQGADSIEGTDASSRLRFRLALDKPSVDGASVQYATVEEDDAVDGQDYVGHSGFVWFRPGERVKWIEVEVLADGDDESDYEFFRVDIVATHRAEVDLPHAWGRIRDDDSGQRWVRVHDTAAYEDSDAIFRVELSRPSDAPLTFRWATSGQAQDLSIPGPPARGRTDFAEQMSTITFGPGEVLKEIRIPLVNDSEAEVDEYFGLYLSSNVDGVEFDRRPGIGVIVDDDQRWSLPELRASDLLAVEGDGPTEVTLTLRLSRASDTTAAVVVVPREPALVLVLDPVVIFAPGETEKRVTLRVQGDESAEPLEILNLDFRDSSGVVVARDSVTLTLVDDDGVSRGRAVRH